MKRDAVDVNIILELIITKVLLDVVLFQGYDWFRDTHEEILFFVQICHSSLDRNEICLKGLFLLKRSKRTRDSSSSFPQRIEWNASRWRNDYTATSIRTPMPALVEESITWRKEVTKKREERLEVWSTRSFSFPEKGSRWGTRESCFVLGLPSFSSFSVFLLFPPSLSFFPFLLLWGFISGLLSV